MEIGLSRADDDEIVEFARRNDRVCVTFDHDFLSHLAMTRADGPSVILIRAEGLESAGQAELIKKVYAFCGEAIESGAAVSADKSAVRVRRLPLA
jgi:predicted nuclease of predicted toxin-antitoxin system